MNIYCMSSEYVGVYVSECDCLCVCIYMCVCMYICDTICWGVGNKYCILKYVLYTYINQANNHQ